MDLAYTFLGRMTMNPDKAVKNLNSMLRGELAATETYQQAMEKAGSDPRTPGLQAIHDEHRETANEFRKCIHMHGGAPDQGSGAWGTFAKAIEGTATVFGSKAALKALKEGEEQGISAYKSMLKDPEMPADCKTIAIAALDRCHSHVSELNRMMESCTK
jgi:hypothetical protein